MKAEEKPRVTTADVKAYMSATYSEANGYACLFEVSSGTGSNAQRSADIVVLNLWPSRGMDLVGYEVKTSRSDWLRELKQPEKAWPVMQYMDRWWLLTSPGVAKAAEVPTGWGFAECDGKKLRVITPAPKLEAKPVSKTFLGAMLRKPIRNIDAEVARRVSILVAEERKTWERQQDQRTGGASEELAKLNEKLKALEESTGIAITTWMPTDEVAAAIRFAMKSNAMSRWSGLPGLITEMERVVQSAKRLEQTIKGTEA